MNYSKMSNKEINMEIAKRMPFNSSCIISYVENSDAVHVNMIISQFTVDYCGSWSDAAILIQSMIENEFFVMRCTSGRAMIDWRQNSCIDENPLRAAAIVWLMADDEKNGKP